MIVYSHLGNAYTVVHKVGLGDKTFRMIYPSPNPRRISEQYDMEVQVGGMRMYINADGEMVKGYNTFAKEDLAKIYAFLSNTP